MFRKDINGLRAIAVLGVIIFHFNPRLMSGGFAGVDVFFVISGFLMTGIIVRGLEKNKFSIKNFYIARANRIIPALAVLCFLVLLFGALFLTPIEYSLLGKHALGSISFLSNFTYWFESGYFDSSSQDKWLLHTWSLSVEWQFYLLYPLVMILLGRLFSIKFLKYLILAGTFVSFLLCMLIVEKLPSGAYFLLPARMWEMLIGGVAYLYPITIKEQYKKYLEWISLLVLFCSYIFISESNAWPSYLTLLPVLGAVGIIQAQRQNSWITGNTIFQKIGLWSYSIYLWHWPVVVFMYYYSLSGIWLVTGGVISIFVGSISYRYIEQWDFRKNFTWHELFVKCRPILAVYIVGLIASYTLISQGAMALSADKLLSITTNIVPSPVRSACHTGGSDYLEPNESCVYFNNNVRWAVIGDSHVVEFSYALAKNLESNNE